ncbi:UDP-N-acetylglucosamine 1-carboxyvinyltransferase [Salipaludibacillus aurantiacus]|uniref:UDP-N-acetylglucosamine 1-carboxyvinyltransferase n=1 Tax=Salipaludibacillus aurantiacus TaxID=1601833 RepID=A0A1H9X9K2_9BACI|nr:UDP-N-acetylglucosamine 1-carboxyvinyltransferase [Salipaludibacillus aurantiacus]SES42876.1 UDP-N-acetylglucosamine 1-carboxyvinyltransferase [Salipaludibacillus aurantiacus]
MTSSVDTALKQEYIVKGGNKLFGEVKLSGAKNAALPMIAAACLGEKFTVLKNVPTSLKDVNTLIGILQELGADINVDGTTVSCKRGGFPNQKIAPQRASEIRYSLLLLGLTAALGEQLELPLPGGCKIGDRKYDLHILGMQKLGAKVEENERGIYLESHLLVGNNIEFYLPTTSGTENVMIASVLAEGNTTLLNANTRPEVIQLADLLNAMGAKVSCGNRVVAVEGQSVIPGGVEVSVMPGWDEAVTYAVAAGVTGGEICIPNFNTSFIKEDVRYLNLAGVQVFEWGSSLYVSGKGEKKTFDLFTAPYPGINSDMQPIFATLALAAQGTSTIADLRFTDRFQYVEELKKFEANINAFGNTAIIEGGNPLKGTKVRATDLRGGAACILAGLFAGGETVITNISQIHRGYENIHEKLSNLGADIHVK